MKEEGGGSILGCDPLYLTENSLGGQLPHVLWCWLIGLLSPTKKQQKKQNKKMTNETHVKVKWLNKVG